MSITAGLGGCEADGGDVDEPEDEEKRYLMAEEMV